MKARLTKSAWFFLILSLLVFLGGKIFYTNVVGDLLNHFQHYLILTVIVIFLANKIYLKAPGINLTAIITFTIISIPYLYLLAINKMHHPEQDSVATIRILSLNANVNNENYDIVFETIKKSDADFVSFIEYSVHHREELHEKLSAIYPYFALQPTHSPNGLALYSRHPIEKHEVIYPTGDYGLISAVTSANGRKFNLLCSHPFPPLSQKDHVNRNLLLKNLRTFSLEKNLPLIVAGDLNITLWSPNLFSHLVANGLKATPFTPTTWPNKTFIPMIGIDHVLVDFEFEILDISRSKEINSDHYPIIAEIAI